MKPVLAVAAVSLILSSAALAQQTPTSGIQAQPPAVDTGSTGYQGQGGPGTTTPTSGVPANSTSSARQPRHATSGGTAHARAHWSTRTHATAPTAAPGTVPSGSDATGAGSATGAGNGGR